MHCNRKFILKKKDPLCIALWNSCLRREHLHPHYYSMDVFIVDQLVCKLGFFKREMGVNRYAISVQLSYA